MNRNVEIFYLLNRECSEHRAVSKVRPTVSVQSAALTQGQAHNRFSTCLLSRRWHVVRSQPIQTLLFRCVKSLPLLWKPHSWF